MIYAKIKNKKVIEYPYNDLKRDHANVSFPNPLTDEVLAQFDVYVIHETEKPKHKWNELVQESTPTFDGKKWVQTWEVMTVSTDVKEQRIRDELQNVRAKRNKLLTDCDWTQLADADLTTEEKKQWVKYRKQLRDLLNREGTMKNPFGVKWPTPPDKVSDE